MMHYQIKIDKRALKELVELPLRERNKLTALIDSLSEDPYPSGCKKLQGQKTILWRVRSGNYRIIYTIESDILTVTVIKIGHRREIYDR
jgi:mRNA interferase RelE/StbE